MRKMNHGIHDLMALLSHLQYEGGQTPPASRQVSSGSPLISMAQHLKIFVFINICKPYIFILFTCNQKDNKMTRNRPVYQQCNQPQVWDLLPSACLRPAESLRSGLEKQGGQQRGES